MPLFLQLATLLVIAWLPGALLYRAPLLERRRREALAAEERAFWAVVLSLAISLSIVLALAALDRYSFPRLVVADALLSAAGLLLWRGRLRLGGAPRIGLTALIPIALVILCVWRFFPPAEYIIGGRDPGVYMNEGIQIAQRGSLTIRDAAVAAVPPFARELFLPRHYHGDGTPRADYYGPRFMGFFVQDADAGTVMGQFPHLFPASIAVGYGLDGLTGARRTVGVWGVLGVLAVYFAGARLFGRVAAGVAAALLALHVIQLWFARYPNAEVVMQAFLFAALLATARAHQDGDPFFAPVGGGLLGLLLFLRYDVGLAIGAVAAALALGLFAGQRPRWTFAAALLVPAALAVPYLFGPMRAYLVHPLAWASRAYYTWPPWIYALAAIAALLAIAGAWLAYRAPRSRTRVREIAPSLLALSLIAAALYALFLRQPVEGSLARHDAHALRMFANLYVTVPGLLAALLGLWLMARQRFWRDPALFLVVAFFSALLFYKIRIVPEHFWLARRFVAVILPGTLLFASAAAFATAGSGRLSKLVRWSLGGVFVVLLAGTYIRASAPVVPHTEYEGLIPKIEELASRVHADDLVIVEGRDAQSDVHVLAPPLAYIYAKNVLLLHTPRPDKETFAAFLQWARARYDRVLFLGGGGTDLLSHRFALRPIASERFRVPEFETTRGSLPRRPTGKDFEFSVYEFGPPRERDDMWFDLDIGINDDLHVLRFHGKEVTDGRTFRWTQARSFVAVTSISPDTRELTLVMGDGGRPDAAPAALVEVFLHGQQLGAIRVQGPMRPYSLQIPRELAARAAAALDPVELRLLTATWNPATVLGANDDRELGVMVDRVTIR